MSAATTTASRPLDESRSPLKEQSPTWGNTLGLEGNAETEQGDSADAALVQQGHARNAKRIATLQAGLALKGHELRQRQDGTFTVSRWGQTRELLDLDAVESFATLVGVTA